MSFCTFNSSRGDIVCVSIGESQVNLLIGLSCIGDIEAWHATFGLNMLILIYSYFAALLGF